MLISDELEGDCPDISLEERGEGGMPKDGLLRTNALLGLSLFDSVIDDDRPDAFNDEDCFDLKILPNLNLASLLCYSTQVKDSIPFVSNKTNYL